MTPAEVADEMLHRSAQLDDALSYARRAADEHAAAESEYRALHAQSFVTAKSEGATDGHAKALADVHAKEAKRRQVLAADMAQVAVEAVRSRRAQLSAAQTAGNAMRAELEMARHGPVMGP